MVALIDWTVTIYCGFKDADTNSFMYKAIKYSNTEMR